MREGWTVQKFASERGRRERLKRYPESQSRNQGTRSSCAAALTGLLLLLGLGTSCQTKVPLPPANLSAPGWHVQEGQAIWKPTQKRPELTGELLLATNLNGGFFVQFAKPPFTLATAQVAGRRWQIEFGSGDYSRRGAGQPPARFVWFHLPEALAGASPGCDWRFERVATNSWRMENGRTGEELEGAFFR